MPEHDMILSNDTGANFRTDLNAALAALVTHSSKGTAPTTTYAYMLWADTGNALLKMRNSTNNGWITLGSIATEMGHLTAGTAVTITAQHTFNPGSALPPFILGANALNQKVIGLDADRVDGKEIADIQKGTLIYAEDAGANDTYAITLSPVPSSLIAGMVVNFKAATANTGACTLNVNSLGDVTIKKSVSSDLATGDILANQRVSVIYDGTNFQLLSPVSGSAYNPVLALPSVNDTVSANSPTTSIWNAATGGVTAFEVCGLNSGVWRKINGATTHYELNFLGIALATVSAGLPANVALPGSYIRHDAWNWNITASASIGTDIYITMGGTMTQTKPGAGTPYRVVGYPISADVMFFSPEGWNPNA